jgi:hypothetical protein
MCFQEETRIDAVLRGAPQILENGADSLIGRTQSRALEIDQGNYSPEALKTIVNAGTQVTSHSRRWAG